MRNSHRTRWEDNLRDTHQVIHHLMTLTCIKWEDTQEALLQKCKDTLQECHLTDIREALLQECHLRDIQEAHHQTCRVIHQGWLIQGTQVVLLLKDTLQECHHQAIPEVHLLACTRNIDEFSQN